MYFFSNSEVYLKYTSFHKKSRSINEVLLKYKQSTFLFFSVFILHLYFFLGSSLKVYFYWTSRSWSINEVYLKYTSYIVFSVSELLICFPYWHVAGRRKLICIYKKQTVIFIVIEDMIWFFGPNIDVLNT